MDAPLRVLEPSGLLSVRRDKDIPFPIGLLAFLLREGAFDSVYLNDDSVGSQLSA